MTGKTYPPLKTTGRMPKTLMRLAARHPDKIEEMSNEKTSGMMGRDDNGYWIELRDGWICTLYETHHINGFTVQECLEAFAFVVPCDSPGAYCRDGCMERIAVKRARKEA